MELNLRKAAIVLRAIDSAVATRRGTLHSITTATIFVADRGNLSNVIEKANLELALKVVEIETLIDIQSRVRRAVKRAQSSGPDGDKIDSLLNEKAAIGHRQSVAVALSNVRAFDFALESRRLDDRAARLEKATDVYGRDPGEVSVPILTADQIKDYNDVLLKLRRRVSEIDDTLGDLNRKVMITVSDTDYEFIQNIGVI